MSGEFRNRKARRKSERLKREKKNAYERARRAKHGHRWLKIKSRYGITEADFALIVKEQGGVCACCKTRLPVDIDHCHRTNQLRGLLCRACNIGIGLLGDNVEGLMQAITYLKVGGIVSFAPVNKEKSQ